MSDSFLMRHNICRQIVEAILCLTLCICGFDTVERSQVLSLAVY